MTHADLELPDDWSVHTTWHDGIPVVAVVGEVDMATAPVLAAALIAQVEQRPAAVLVHLGEVSFFGSSGITALLDAYTRATIRRVPLHLVAAGPRVVRTLQITGLTETFSRHESVADAVREIARREPPRLSIAMVSEQANPLAGGLGQGAHVARLSASLRKLGHEVVVYTRRDDPASPERVRTADGYDVVHVPAGPARQLTEEEIVTHLGEFAEFLAERWRLRAPDVVHAHDWTSGLAAVIGAHGIQTPVVYSYNPSGTRDVPRRADAEALVARRASWIVTSSAQETSELQRLGVPRAQVSVVPCGVDTELFHPDGPAAVRNQPRRIVTVGELLRHNGFADIIAALTTLEGTELVIAGADPSESALADQLHGLAQKLGVRNRVVFAGEVPPTKMPALLRSADVVVCAPWFDSFGIIALQAMACGKPVVATSVGALSDVVVHKITGLLVPPRNPKSLARTLRQLLSDGTRREELGIAARDRVMARHSCDRLAKEALAVYARVTRTATAMTSVSTSVDAHGVRAPGV